MKYLAPLALLSLTGCTAILAVDPMDMGTIGSIFDGVGGAVKTASSFLPEPWGYIAAGVGTAITGVFGTKAITKSATKQAAQEVNMTRDLARIQRNEVVGTQKVGEKS